MVNIDWEVWKDIPWYEGLYKVSNMGRVCSNKFSKILSARKIYWDYIQYALYWEFGRKCFMWHRLVWLTFNNYPLDFTGHSTCNLVCHINDIRSDNRLSNLFIGTNQDNIKDCVSKERHQICSSKKPVCRYLNWVFMWEFESIRFAAKETSIERTAIWTCCNGKRKTAWWFTWSYSI